MNNNTNSNIQETATGTGTTGYFNSQYCGFRLPCGYCTRLSQPCPMCGYGYGQPVWTSVQSGLENVNKCEVQY